MRTMLHFRPPTSHALISTCKVNRPRWFESLATGFNATPHQPGFVQSQTPEGTPPLVEIPTHPTDARELKDQEVRKHILVCRVSALTLLLGLQDSKPGGSYKQALVDSWRGQHIGTVDFLPRLTEPVSSSFGYSVIGTFNTILSPPAEAEVPQEPRVTSVYIPGKLASPL